MIKLTQAKNIKKILFRGRCLLIDLMSFISLSKRNDGNNYWDNRAWKYGRRAVLNIGHTEHEIEEVTKKQKMVIFPLLQSYINGTEKVVLDFGCGPGRFTVDLAHLIDGKAIGVDPIRRFLHVAPRNERIEYLLLVNGIIPCNDESIDIVFVCLVLGGITEINELHNSISEIGRVLQRGGLLFLIENTSDKTNAEYWHFRSPEAYCKLINFAPLKVLSNYEDLGETITVMAGRKHV
jgi:ubiquinone/menaquinone biosynthesis C-methylase UbiE